MIGVKWQHALRLTQIVSLKSFNTISIAFSSNCFSIFSHEYCKMMSCPIHIKTLDVIIF